MEHKSDTKDPLEGLLEGLKKGGDLGDLLEEAASNIVGEPIEDLVEATLKMADAVLAYTKEHPEVSQRSYALRYSFVYIYSKALGSSVLEAPLGMSNIVAKLIGMGYELGHMEAKKGE